MHHLSRRFASFSSMGYHLSGYFNSVTVAARLNDTVVGAMSECVCETSLGNGRLSIENYRAVGNLITTLFVRDSSCKTSRRHPLHGRHALAKIDCEFAVAGQSRVSDVS
jgi:hypothetical protein